MILSSTANGTYKRGELRWVRHLHQIMLICENFEYPSPFDYCEGRVELGINAFFRHSGLQRKQI